MILLADLAFGVDAGWPVDYQGILDESSREADIVLWDGGNNDFSFIRPDLDIVVVDSLRAGHEIDYFPGEVNFRRADVLVIGRGATAPMASAPAATTARATERGSGAEAVSLTMSGRSVAARAATVANSEASTSRPMGSPPRLRSPGPLRG